MEQKKEYVSPKMYIEDFKQRTCLLGGSIPVKICDGGDDDDDLTNCNE